MAEKKFPTPEMLKAREEWSKLTKEEKQARENAMRAELEKYYKNMRPPLDVTENNPDA